MRAMMLHRAHEPLRLEAASAVPRPGPHEVLIRVHACGVCRTDLHILDGELAHPKLPLIPGHEIVGTVVETGPQVTALAAGARIGVPWLGWTCGECAFCRGGRENLCAQARFTGYDIDGGYAEYTVAHERFCFPLPPEYGDVAAAPLLCAGLIGYRALRLAGEARRLGLYGFGAAAHIAVQVARHRGQEVYAFTKPGRCGRPGLRPRPRCGVGGRLGPSPARRRSMPPSSSHPSAPSFRRRLPPRRRAAWWSAPASI